MGRAIDGDAVVLGQLDQVGADEIHVGVVVLVERMQLHEGVQDHQVRPAPLDGAAQHVVELAQLPPALGVEPGKLEPVELPAEQPSLELGRVDSVVAADRQ